MDSQGIVIIILMLLLILFFIWSSINGSCKKY